MLFRSEDVFAGRALPAAMELIGLTFLVGGIDTQTVTHLIRHRAGSFAAQCTGDRWLSHERSLVPGSIENSPEFYARWKAHVQEAKQLAQGALTAAPNAPIARLTMARAALASGDLSRSQSELDSLLKDFPNSPQVVALQGALYLSKKDVASEIGRAHV